MGVVQLFYCLHCGFGLTPYLKPYVRVRVSTESGLRLGALPYSAREDVLWRRYALCRVPIYFGRPSVTLVDREQETNQAVAYLTHPVRLMKAVSSLTQT